MTLRGPMSLFALFLLAVAGLPSKTAAQDRVLKVSLNTELQILDPIITTINATRVFAYMVFDELVGIDSQGHYQPQMLDHWDISPDHMTYRFTLRDGLLFSDGNPVTAEDCVVSIQRWAKREAFGAKMMDAAESFSVVDAKTFELKLKRPFAFVIDALGKPGHQIPVIMPARLASHDADSAVPETVGSGPFLFLQKEWRPGDRASFVRNPAYVPRKEPADGLAGGKVVGFDRVELVSVPDQATRVAALQTGELDLLEIVPFDFIDTLRKDPNITVARQKGGDQIMAILNINHLQPPFDNVLVRRALRAAITQSDVMAGLGLPDDMYQKQCYSIYMCNASGTSNTGTEFSEDVGPEAARRLLKEAGYKNEPVVFLHAQSSAVLNPVGLVIADQMKRAGFNVDVRTSDYATVAQRRLSKAPVAQNGWSVVPLIINGIDMVNPLSDLLVSFNCLQGNPGWYCDPALTPMLKAYAEASDPAQQRLLADKIQAEFHDNVNYVLAGQFSGPAAYRSDIKDVLPFSFPLLWSMHR
jgi:peptide/nickel transport system substrate-binding protein